MNKILGLLNLLLFNLVNSLIVLPIKGNNITRIYNNSKKKDFLEDFIMSTFYNQLYTAIGIGNPSQYVVISIIQRQTDFLFNKMNCQFFYNNDYIDKDNLYPNNRTMPINISHIGYKKNKSKSFIQNNETKLSLYYRNNNYSMGKENLILADFRNVLTTKGDKYPHSHLHLVKFGFIYEEIDINNKIQNYEVCGSIGLASYYEKNNNKFIEQLKSSNITKNYYWSFNYTSFVKGYMIFGILPHEYNSNRYNINNLIETYTIIDEGEMKWAMDLNEIYFYSNKNNKKISIDSRIAEGIFEFNLQLIVGSYSYRKLIIKYYFQELFDKNICAEEEYNLEIKYSIIRCKSQNFEKKLKDFPILNLYNRGLQNVFELSYEDLFIKVGDYIYFLIIFRKDKLNQSNQTWKLGIPFLKRHQIIFNTDTKTIGYYVENKLDKNQESNSNINSKNNIKNDNKNSTNFFDKLKTFISLRTFFEIIIVIIFIVILFYFGKKLYNLKIKQKKPYELQDEDYDYFSNDKRIKNENYDINNKVDEYNNKSKGQIIEMEKH